MEPKEVEHHIITLGMTCSRSLHIMRLEKQEDNSLGLALTVFLQSGARFVLSQPLSNESEEIC